MMLNSVKNRQDFTPQSKSYADKRVNSTVRVAVLNKYD